MNILFVDQFSDPGGAQLCLRDLVPEVRRRGWNAQFLLPPNGKLWADLENEGFCVHSLPLRLYTNGRKTARELTRFTFDTARCAASIRGAARRHRTDLVYVNGPRILPAAVGTSLALLFHAHSYLDRQYARQLAIWSLQVKRANVIAASAFVAGSLQPSLPAASMKVIYSGVGDSLFRPRSFGNHPPRIAIVGRISPEKGHLDFVAAAKRLVHARPDARFLVLGATLFSDDSYERRVRECAGGALIEFRGWTGDVPGALHEIDVLAVPSAGLEAAPRVVLEAFAAGTPVVAYPSGGIPEFVRHGETGVLTDSPHADALASSIEWLISKPELMTRLSGNARLEWEQRFTLERYRREVCDFIEARFAVNLQNRQALRASGAMARR